MRKHNILEHMYIHIEQRKLWQVKDLTPLAESMIRIIKTYILV